jgi:D-alanyl-D-alanine dipeptidase
VRVSSLIAASVFIGALVACAQAPAPTASPLLKASESTPPAPTQPITGTITRTTSAYASAQGGSSACELAPADTRALRFESGRFLVTIPATDSCKTKFEKPSAWIDAANLHIDDTAYAPALARVNEQSGLRVDMAYVGRRNFCDVKTERCLINEPLYAQARCYTAPKVADALALAAKTLVARDASMRLVVLDCYRPIYVQERMYSLVANPEWVAQPKPPRYGGHNRAVAIDLTIEKNGVQLDMGSPFDAFDDRSEHNSSKVSEVARANRAMLRELMIQSGFRPYDAEWWHFSLPIETPALNFPL